ncbi:uncharacterized protein MONBRDRAFT_27295 [Monosiga brevicollis MX1]|uniref:Uncharacterized protein n=1 Tax=Monosiga brevicollis TaxID=81824 RepID=A9V4W1_MONBE|nr:uncharacterized protein MONBRDRAFT_27295 [Monosiga brevicollis MX1]EDQ87438.1 predicted protein [Monosiga brevicollis MX1]|eukprot:XP_001747698.1 hypothetical protein [Monosiga brevicollis MX1]
MAAQDSGRLVVDEARLEAIAKEQADVWTDILALQQDITALSNAVADRQVCGSPSLSLSLSLCARRLRSAAPMEQLSSKLNENLKLNDLPYDDEGDDDSIPNHEDSSDSMDKLAMRLSLFKFRDRTTQSYHERSIIEFAHRVRFNRLIQRPPQHPSTFTLLASIRSFTNTLLVPPAFNPPQPSSVPAQHAGRRGYKICWTTALRNRTTPINSTADEEEEPDTEQQEDKKEQPDEKAPVRPLPLPILARFLRSHRVISFCT